MPEDGRSYQRRFFARWINNYGQTGGLIALIRFSRAQPRFPRFLMRLLCLVSATDGQQVESYLALGVLVSQKIAFTGQNRPMSGKFYMTSLIPYS